MNDTATLVAQLEHAALIGGFERTLLRDAAARIAELEAEQDRLARVLRQIATTADIGLNIGPVIRMAQAALSGEGVTT